MQLAAGGIEGTLVLVLAIVNSWTTVHMDGLFEEPLPVLGGHPKPAMNGHFKTSH
jgi:hypothetical protein